MPVALEGVRRDGQRERGRGRLRGAARSVSNCRSGSPAIVDGTDRTTCAVESGVALVSNESVPVSVTLGVAVRSKVAAGSAATFASSVSAAAESERGASAMLQRRRRRRARQAGARAAGVAVAARVVRLTAARRPAALEHASAASAASATRWTRSSARIATGTPG